MLIKKIIWTLLLCFSIINVLTLFARFIYGLFVFDEDTIMVLGISISALGSAVFMVVFPLITIASIWEKRNKKNDHNK